MILYELFEDEQHPVYRKLSADNLARQYDFLQSIVIAAIAADRPMISKALIAALNYHAISCLHVNAGEYRPCPVTVGKHRPPEHYRASRRSHKSGSMFDVGQLGIQRDTRCLIRK